MTDEAFTPPDEATEKRGHWLQQNLLVCVRDGQAALGALEKVVGGLSLQMAVLESKKKPPDVFFFGCRKDETGHYWTCPYGQEARMPDRIDAVYAPRDHHQRECEQGVCRTVFTHGWTITAWWDRSQDKRGASNSALAAQGRFSFDEMIAAGRVKYPWAFERMTFTLVEEAL